MSEPGLMDGSLDAWKAVVAKQACRIAELEKALTWQPIDTAPKDGTWIMGWASGDLNPSRISWGRNHRNNLSWCTAFCSFVEGYITHWTPLPRIPEDEAPPIRHDSGANRGLTAEMQSSDLAEEV